MRRTTLHPGSCRGIRRRRAARPRGHDRATVIIIVLWALAIAALVASSLQMLAWRQASIGFDAVHRVQARWAARAGLENSIALMALHTEDPIPDDAFALARDLSAISYAELLDASYSIQHHSNRVDVNGPLDAHSKLNFNRPNAPAFDVLGLYDLSPDQAAAIVDWTDPDDEPLALGGAEEDYYLLSRNYTPRNAPIRSIAELEMIASVWADFVRGEDLNLNFRRDPNEDDGDFSPPDDDANGWLDGGWSSMLTVYSVDEGATDSGLPRIHLRRAEPRELVDRLLLAGEDQAEQLIRFGRGENNSLEMLLDPAFDLSLVQPDGSMGEESEFPEMEPLTEDQIRAILAECRMLPLFDRRPGRVNINTAAPDLIRDLVEVLQWDEAIADELIYLRNSKPEGITSLVELSDIRAGLPDGGVVTLAQHFDVRSNVFVVSSIGRSSVSGAETEIIAVIDRSTVPLRIIEYREQ